MDKQQQVRLYVQDKLSEYINERYISGIINSDHLIEISISILNTKYPELGGYPGGSFVQAVINNDLMAAFSRADQTNQEHMLFHLRILTNFNPSIIK